MATLYGDVDVSLDGKIYVVRVGNLEFWKLQEAYGVKGIGPCLVAAMESTENTIKFFRVALSRAHPDLTDAEVANLMDYRPGEGKKSLSAAVEEAVKFSCPELYPNEEDK